MNTLSFFKEPDILVKDLKRILKNKASLIISAQNRYIQSYASLSGKTRANNIERAFKVSVNEEHERVIKDGKVKIYTWAPQKFRIMLE